MRIDHFGGLMNIIRIGGWRGSRVRLVSSMAGLALLLASCGGGNEDSAPGSSAADAGDDETPSLRAFSADDAAAARGGHGPGHANA
jgi:hypothetical protein